ncbi:MAG: HAD family phosphatase [Ruminococcaceae bacterium]|nr:HAD family phosphatase [Oscillospiraceae bacterium]
MGIFDGILICTDLDGTLLKEDKTISKENLDAIDFFKREGGYFTFVTGRMPFYASDMYNMVRPNAPFGCINGGGLYDAVAGDYIWKMVLPYDVVDLVKSVDEKFSDVGIQVSTFYKAYFSKENYTMAHFREITNLPNTVEHYTRIKEPMAKIIFGSEEDDTILKIESVLKAHPLADNFDFIRSQSDLFEILPKGIGKGVAITKLVEYLNIDKNKTVAIGDYNNDISMFRAAKAGIAVSNACAEALEAADFVTVSNEENAVARVIYDLADGKYI